MGAVPAERPVAVTHVGEGPRVVLVHGGASPKATWASLRPLSARWSLDIVHRRGYPPSPPPDGRVDFDVDAADIARLLEEEPAHLVGHSYGGVGVTIAALMRPDRVRSLTLIEPALFVGAEHDPEIAWFKRLGEDVLREGLDCDRARLRAFLTIAGGPPVGDGELSPDVVRVVRRAQRNRPPSEASPPLDELRATGIPVLVASGDHTVAAERMCDVITKALGARRLVARGAGHFVQAAPGFIAPFESFLRRCAR